MISYLVKFAADPYDKDSGLPQWWPNYICEKEVTDKSIVDGKIVCTMRFLLGEQYLHQFDNYISTQLKDYIVGVNEKSQL